jgi:hypothetical protein
MHAAVLGDAPAFGLTHVYGPTRIRTQATAFQVWKLGIERLKFDGDVYWFVLSLGHVTPTLRI